MKAGKGWPGTGDMEEARWLVRDRMEINRNEIIKL